MQKRPGLFSDERGAFLVLFAVALAAILGISAVVIDYGIIGLERRKMVTAADAAALAGARVLQDSNGIDTSNAVAVATQYALDNGAQQDLIEVNVINDYEYKGNTIQVIEVNVGNNKDFFFSRVLDLDSHDMDVRGRAVATWSYVTSYDGNDFLPLFIENVEDWNQTIPLHIDNSADANWGIFNIKDLVDGNPIEDAIRGDEVNLPRLNAITEWNGFPDNFNILEDEISEDLIANIYASAGYASAGGYIYKTETGKMSSIVDALKKDKTGHYNQWGRLYRHYQYYVMGDTSNEPISLEGIIPIVYVIDSATSGPLDSIILGFAKYLIEDVVDNQGNGSVYSIANGGSKNSSDPYAYDVNNNRGTSSFYYSSYHGSSHNGTILGRLLGPEESGYTPGTTTDIVQIGIGLKYNLLIE